MKKLLLVSAFIICFLCFPFSVHAQVGIGTEQPSNSSMLDIISADRGILIPRVSLSSTQDLTTITNGNINSLLVFNVQTIADVTPGFYYWFTNKWNRLGAENNFEALTSISQDVKAGTITYIDEKGTSTVLTIGGLIAQHETLTSAVFTPATGILTYTDEDGAATDMDLSVMIPN
ncbi:hypothetical protein RB618_23235, partial [Flavobacterium sp. LHD-85]|nr:hypothetical protein [Flavobacterium sp. LHD-85]